MIIAFVVLVVPVADSVAEPASQNTGADDLTAFLAALAERRHLGDELILGHHFATSPDRPHVGHASLVRERRIGFP